MRKPQSPTQHCLFGRVAFGSKPDPYRELFLNCFFLAARAAHRDTSRRQAKCRLESLRRSRFLQKFNQLLNQKKMQTSIAAVLALPKLENNVSETSSSARRFLCRWSSEWLRNTKERIVALNCRKETLDGQAGCRISSTCAAQSSSFGDLTNRLYAHACEATRRRSTLQAQTLAIDNASSSRTVPPPISVAFRSC